jgi:hypothetical protein
MIVAFGLVAADEVQPLMPPAGVPVRHRDVEWGPTTWPWEGAAVVDDPVNAERLFLCGRVGGVAFGSIGSWALGNDGTTWREMQFASAVLDPLRDRCRVARSAAQDGEAAARSLYYAALDPAREAAAVRGDPAKRIARAVELAGALAAALGTATAEGWEREAVEHARPLVGAALDQLRTAEAGFSAGHLDAGLLRSCFDAQWVLDEAADCLANAPGPREHPSAVYDPETRCVVLFGGLHGDYALNDTWVYECERQRWRQVWSRTAPPPRGGATFTGDVSRKQLVLAGGLAILDKVVYQQGEKPAPPGEWVFDVRTNQWSGEGGVAPGTRVYRTIVPAYDPRWYDAASRGDPAATERFLAGLEPNVWTAVPAPPAPAPEREWGTAAYDPDRDQIYRWSGGHEADPSSLVSTYHPAINRWSIPYVAEIMATASRKGMSFNGRPDCANHTYLHYAYDPASRRLVCVAMGGTAIYNPDRRDFDCSLAQPFIRQIYETCTVGTPRGVVAWVRDYFGIVDVATREWRKLPVTGTLPKPCCDGSAICYDAKRDVLWMATFLGYQKPSGNLWRYDMKRGAVVAMDPAGRETIGMAAGFNREIRECIYHPGADLILFNNFVEGGEVAYDPARNRWVVLSIARTLDRLGTVSDTLVYDAKRDLVWNLNAYKAIYVLQLDPATVTVRDRP